MCFYSWAIIQSRRCLQQSYWRRFGTPRKCLWKNSTWKWVVACCIIVLRRSIHNLNVSGSSPGSDLGTKPYDLRLTYSRSRETISVTYWHSCTYTVWKWTGVEIGRTTPAYLTPQLTGCVTCPIKQRQIAAKGETIAIARTSIWSGNNFSLLLIGCLYGFYSISTSTIYTIKFKFKYLIGPLTL